jgi:hypothetical protein
MKSRKKKGGREKERREEGRGPREREYESRR